MWKKFLALVALIAVTCGALLFLRAYKRASESKRLANRASQTRIRAEQGDVKAENLLGSLYYYGNGVPTAKRSVGIAEPLPTATRNPSASLRHTMRASGDTLGDI